ncbi:secreted RxLR effector peptide protein, putative [Phytophthora infestans T30-4]|uniref:Secreted RxLR effector peptide protein n=2 Tax=Phytophthora infestans TaxID=4787 RepID=A0A833SV07_PHYIN
MPLKLALTPRLSYFILLAALALLVCIHSGSKVATASSVIDARNDALDREVGGQIHRYLRESKWTAEQEDGSPEARAIGVKLSAATVLQKLINSQPTKKLSTRAMEILTSNNQRATDKLFASLGVWEVESKLFASTPYQKWAASVMKSYKKNPEKGQAAIFSTLVRHHGDDILAKLVSEAQPTAAAIRTAKKIESMQIANWVTNRKTEEDIYKLLKLDADKEGLLRNPLLNTWVSFVKKLDNEDPYNLLLLKLTKTNDEEALAHMLIAAKGDSLTSSVVRNLENALLTAWLRDGKTTGDVAKLLRLNADKGESFLRSAALPTWLSYIRQRNKDPNKVLFLELQNRFSDAELARVLVAASRDKNVKINVTALQKLQLSKWHGRGDTADDIFRHLGLSKEGEELLESSVFNTWVSYVKLVDYTNTDALVFSVMKKHYSDEILAKMIAQAKTSVLTRALASKLAAEMWRSPGKSADDIFKFFQLDKTGDDLFEAPMFDAWILYVERLNKYEKHPDKFALFTELEKRFDYVDLARMLSHAKIQAEMKGHSVERLFSLRNQQFDQWMNQKRLDPGRVAALVAEQPRDIRNNGVVLGFYDFYKANGGSPLY